jgi:hypothetical protein
VRFQYLFNGSKLINWLPYFQVRGHTHSHTQSVHCTPNSTEPFICMPCR